MISTPIKTDASSAYNGANFYVDPTLVTVVFVLLCLGYVMVCSASLHLGDRLAADSFFYPKRQFLHILLGLIAAAIAWFLPIAIWEKTGQWLFLGGLILLVAVLVPGLGVEVNGSLRWLSVAGIRIQVSELVKLISVIYMAGYLTRHSSTVCRSVHGIVRPLILLSFACLLLLLEPDFGAAAILLMTALVMMFIAGARLWQFALLFVLVIALGSMLIYTSPYRLARVASFMDPWADPLDSGFQLTQALIAFGRGEWFGVGLGSGIQKLYYLPEAHTDFLYSVIAEELGLLGAATVIVLFSVLVLRAFSIARLAETTGAPFAVHLAYGVGILFGLQSIINMGVNMGILPTKGLTLPLMSYGGGSMIVMCAAVGLLCRIHAEAMEASLNSPKAKKQWLHGS